MCISEKMKLLFVTIKIKGKKTAATNHTIGTREFLFTSYRAALDDFRILILSGKDVVQNSLNNTAVQHTAEKLSLPNWTQRKEEEKIKLYNARTRLVSLFLNKFKNKNFLNVREEKKKNEIKFRDTMSLTKNLVNIGLSNERTKKKQVSNAYIK